MHNEALRAGLLALVGAGAGLTGAVAGVASLVAYPGLLAFGLPPVTANVTSTVANVFGGIGSSTGSRPELAGQAGRVRRLAGVATVGSIIGATLLLATPSGWFGRAAPVFIGLASLAVFLRPRKLAPAGATRPDPAAAAVPDAPAVPSDPDVPSVPDGPADSPVLTAGTFGLGVYAGYFGAAAGTVLLALLLYITGESVPRATGVKNVTFMFANAVAAVAFTLFGPVRWSAALPLAVGFLVGGRLGPPLLRRVPPVVLRPLIAACGVALAVRLALSAW